MHRLAKNLPGFGECLKSRHQDPLELEERLFIEDNVGHVVHGDPCFFQAEINRLDRKTFVMLDAAETLFFDCYCELPVLY